VKAFGMSNRTKLRLRRRAIHADQLSIEIASGLNSFMNPTCLADEILVDGTGYNSGVVGMLAVQAKEMLAVQR
jgi:hypothetical protein